MPRFICVVALLLATVSAAPPDVMLSKFDTPPPGQIIQNRAVPMAGTSNAPWRVVASRQLLGSEPDKTPAYQWYLSFYAPDGQGGEKLVYQLPNLMSRALSRVRKSPSADLYYPRQQLRVLAPAFLMQPDLASVVAVIHEAPINGCGTARVAVFSAGISGNVVESVHVTDACLLRASLVKGGALMAIRVTGPHGKRLATSLLTFQPKTGWTLSPAFFALQDY